MLRWLRGGDLRGLRIDNEWRVSERQLGAFLEERANIPAKDPALGPGTFHRLNQLTEVATAERFGGA